MNIHDAKTHFSRLIERVLQGEEVTIARAGRPVARLVPVPAGRGGRSPGTAKGLVEVTEDFDEPLPVPVQQGFE